MELRITPEVVRGLPRKPAHLTTVLLGRDKFHRRSERLFRALQFGIFSGEQSFLLLGCFSSHSSAPHPDAFPALIHVFGAFEKH